MMQRQDVGFVFKCQLT